MLTEYLANMDYLIDSDEFLNALRDNSVFESILLQKLAFPKFWFLAAWSLYWLPSQGSVVPQSVLQRGGGEVLSMITQCKALNGEKRVRRQWEACEALRGQKIPELCVWDMDGNQVIHGKTEDRTQSAT
jgi:hypothetical protein